MHSREKRREWQTVGRSRSEAADGGGYGAFTYICGRGGYL